MTTKRASKKYFPQKYTSGINFSSKQIGDTKPLIEEIRENKILKTKYDYGSQIVALPGSVKRPVEGENIVQDKSRNKLSTPYFYRRDQIYGTKISCLPGGKKVNDAIPISKRSFCDETRRRFYENSKNPCYEDNNNKDFDKVFRTEAGINSIKKVGYVQRNKLYGETPILKKDISNKTYDNVFRSETGITGYKKVGYPQRERFYHENHQQDDVRTDYKLYKNHSQFNFE